MQIEAYIQKLLYKYNCIVVPKFGAFLAHEKPAEINKETRTFNPPFKSISFNAQLNKNDGLLVTEIARDKKLTYEALLQEVEKVSELWKKKLALGETITLEGIGKIRYSQEQKILFQPENKINYLTTSFGLHSFTITPIQPEITKKQSKTTKVKIPLTPPQKKQKTHPVKWLKYAATAALIISIATLSYHTYDNLKQLQARQKAQQKVSQIIQKATFFDTAPLKLPPLNLHIQKKQPLKHYVIAGAFRIEKNARKKIQQLKNKGYNASYLGTNTYGLHQVAYAGFQNTKEARIFLRKIQTTESADAWLLSQK